MAGVPITDDDLENLATKLLALHDLTRAERSILWAALAVAADALSPRGGVGHTDLVVRDKRGGHLMVEIPAEVNWIDTAERAAQIPAEVAKAFTRERHNEYEKLERAVKEQADKIGGDPKIRSTRPQHKDEAN
jgi:hypothetical protein